MRIQCNVVDMLRSASGAPQRPSKGFVSLGTLKKDKQQIVVLDITMEKGKKSSYKLDGSAVIDSVIDRFCEQGKLTVNMRQPARSILISNAKPPVLRNFCNQLRMMLKGDLSALTEITNVKKSDFNTGAKELRIVEREHYPSTSQGFPSSLVKMTLSGIGLRRVDGRWFACQSLTSLDLSHNMLGKSPDLEKLRLVGRLVNLECLSLADNQLTEIPMAVATSLPQSLRSLDLSYNKLERILPCIYDLALLNTINISNNHLKYLSDKLIDLPHMNIFASHNRLECVPYLVSAVREKCQLSGNPLSRAVSCPRRVRDPPSLFSLCSAYLFRLGDVAVIRETNPSFFDVQILPVIAKCVFCKNMFPRHILREFCRHLPSSEFALESDFGVRYPTEIVCCGRCFRLYNR